MNIAKSSDNYKIIDSGTALTFSQTSSLFFEVECSEDFVFNIEIKFHQGNDGKRELKKEVDEQNNKINITCYNFDNSLGTGTISPINLATFQSKIIYLHFWVYSLGENSIRKIDYCFYIEK